MSNSTTSDSSRVYYQYDPTLVGAVLFATLFLGTTLLHAYQIAKTKTIYFIPMFIGGTCMVRFERADLIIKSK
jgi:hypothetical protein